MIHGHKPNGYVDRGFADGVRGSGETRQCCHCQYMWHYQPDWGKPNLRGWCLKHDAFVCARPECEAEQQRMLQHYETVTGKTHYTCIAFEEYNQWLMESMLHAGNDWTINNVGLLVPKEAMASA